MIASTMRSVSARADLSVVNVIFSISASAIALSILSLDTSLSTLFWIRSLPLSRKSWSVSYAMMEEWMPSLAAAAAAVCAMPWPIKPSPITPSLSKLCSTGAENCLTARLLPALVTSCRAVPFINPLMSIVNPASGR